jgi:tetratricopeptide (TPR) repeat protein
MSKMQKKQLNRYIIPFVIATFVLLIVGCSRDPMVRRQKLLESGQRYFDKSEYSAASIEFRKAIQVDPKFAEAHYRLGLTYWRLHNWQEAYRSLRTAANLNPQNIASLLELAAMETGTRNNEDARQDIQQILVVDPNNAKAHLLLGQVAVQERKYEAALQEFLRAQQLAPNDPWALTQVGNANVLLKRPAEAAKSYEQAIAANSGFLVAYLDLADLYRRQGDAKSQVATLESAVQNNPKSIGAHLILASTYIHSSNSEKVKPLFAQLAVATGNSVPALLATADFYLRLGDNAGAEDALDQVVKTDPQNKVARARLVEVHLNRQEWQKAEELLRDIQRTSGGDPEIRLLKARLLFARGNKSEAKVELEQLVHDVPDLALAHFYLGLAYAEEGQEDRAISSLNDALAHAPDFTLAYVTLGELHRRKGNVKLALSYAEAALAQNPGSAPATLLQANSYLQLGEDATAAIKLQSLAAAQPQSAAVQERLGFAALKEKQFAKAEEYLEQSLALRPDFVPAMEDLVQLYAQQHRSDQIIARLQQQLQRAPKQSAFYHLLGNAHWDSGDLASAEQSFLNALKQDPGAYIASFQLARVYANQNKSQDAIARFQDAIKHRTDFLPAYVELATLYQKTGAIDKAQQTYQTALEHMPDSAPVMNNLAWLYSENGGNLDLAMGLAQRAKQKAPDDPSVSDTLAWIQYRKGLYSSAARSFEELVRRSPKVPTYQYHLGMSLMKTGQKAEARAALQRALDLRLAAEDAAQAKRALDEISHRSL